MGMQLIVRWRILGLAAVLLVGLSACSPIVIIPDNALESAIRAEIRKPLAVFLTQRDLQGVRKLDASFLNIESLEGLQFCVNVTKLNLNGNFVSDIDQIGNLSNLVRLHLADNMISDIDVIAGLLSLEFLDLSGASNEIVDWRHLAANVRNGGLGAGAVVRVPVEHTFDGEGNPRDAFVSAYEAMRDAGVVIETD